MLGFAQCAKSGMESVEAGLEQLSPDRKDQMKGIMALAGAQGEERASLRTETTYTISEALDLLDETLNYAYCRPSTPLQNTIILSDTLYMAVTTSTTVTEQEVADLFDAASMDLGTQYHAMSLTNQQPWAFSVRQFGNLENDELPIIIQLSVAYGGYVNALIDYEEEDYFYAFQGGLCDMTPGPGAPDVLRNNLKYDYIPTGTHYCKNAKYFRVCNVWNGDVIRCDADGLPGNIYEFDWQITNPMVKASIGLWDNINDFKLFRQCECAPNYDECLSGDVEMPFNEGAMGDLLDAHTPENYAPGNIWVGSKKLDDSELGGDINFHNMNVMYCRFIGVSSNDEPIDLPCTGC